MLVLRKLPRISHSSRFLSSKTPNPSLDIPSSFRYDELIYEAGRTRDFAAVHGLLNKRVRDKCLNTKKTFKFITEATRDLPSVLDDLSQTLARLDKGFSRKSAFDSLIARLSKLNQIDESLRVVEKMVRGGHGANACTFHPILNALSRRKRRDDMERAWRVMDLMREHKISPDVTAYNYLLTAYCFAGDLETAAGVLATMEAAGMVADTRTYDALVLGACRGKKLEAAMAILRRVVDEGVPVLYSTHAHVINALLGEGYFAQAVKFAMCCAGRDKGLDMESMGCLARRLINLNRIEEAKVVLEEMRNRDLAMGDKLRDFCSMHS